ncbi:transposase [Streptomyces sp. NPDC087917]|uniref:transposase n=1 Tax=Streptomyces sp. NPDC087917 TaxID=3155060 RepID=UPI003423DA15
MTAMPDCSSSRNVKGLLYVRGLLLDGRRKSMQPMAERLGIDHQRLQQFMTSSTWPVEDVRARLAWRAVAVVRPEVWVVDDTGFPRDGTASPGGRPPVLGHAGKGRQLPDRRQRPRRFRHGLLPAVLAPVPAGRMGRA